MVITEPEIGRLVLGLTPPYLDPNCQEALHEVDLGALKSEFRSMEERDVLIQANLVVAEDRNSVAY